MTEKLLNKAIYVAQCGQENPIEVYRDEGGYEYQCTQHGRQASRKILFLTPKGEVEFPYGPRYFCDLCEVPDIQLLATSDDAYFDTFYGPLELNSQIKANG